MNKLIYYISSKYIIVCVYNNMFVFLLNKSQCMLTCCHSFTHFLLAFSTRQGLITSLCGSCSKTGSDSAKKNCAILSYVKLLHHPPMKRPVFPIVRCNTRKISVSIVRAIGGRNCNFTYNS